MNRYITNDLQSVAMQMQKQVDIFNSGDILREDFDHSVYTFDTVHEGIEYFGCFISDVEYQNEKAVVTVVFNRKNAIT
jgi:hypothetical protein